MGRPVHQKYRSIVASMYVRSVRSRFNLWDAQILPEALNLEYYFQPRSLPTQWYLSHWTQGATALYPLISAVLGRWWRYVSQYLPASVILSMIWYLPGPRTYVDNCARRVREVCRQYSANDVDSICGTNISAFIGTHYFNHWATVYRKHTPSSAQCGPHSQAKSGRFWGEKLRATAGLIDLEHCQLVWIESSPIIFYILYNWPIYGFSYT